MTSTRSQRVERFEFVLRDGERDGDGDGEGRSSPPPTSPSPRSDFEQEWRANELRRLAREGVPDDPPHIRAATYRHLLDLAAPSTLACEYSEFIDLVETRIAALAPPTPHQPLDRHDKLLREIERDVARTFSSLAWFGAHPSPKSNILEEQGTDDGRVEPRQDVLWQRIRLLDDLDDRIASELSTSTGRPKPVEPETAPPIATVPTLTLNIPSSNDSSALDIPPSPNTPFSALSDNRQSSSSSVLPTSSRASLLPRRPSTRREALLRPLFVYAFLNPGISYVQGMSYLAAVFFYIFTADSTTSAEQVEATTFFAFGALVSQLQDLYVPALDGNVGARSPTNGLEATIQRFKGLLLWLDPTLAETFERKHVELGGFVLRWSTTVFASEFSLPDLVRVWDRVISVYPQDQQRLESLSPVLSHVLDLGLAAVITKRATFISPYTNLQKMYAVLQSPSIEGSAVDQLLHLAWDIRERRLGHQSSRPSPSTPKSQTSAGALAGLFKQKLWSPSSPIKPRSADFELDTASSLGDSTHTGQSAREGGKGRFGSIAFSSPRSSSGSLANNVTMVEGKLLPPPPARMQEQETIASIVEAELELPEYGVEDDPENEASGAWGSTETGVQGWFKNSVSRFASSDAAANLSKRATNLQLAAVQSASTTAARFQSSDAAAQLLKAQTNLAIQAQLLRERVANEQLSTKVKEAGERFMASNASERGDTLSGGPRETPFTPPTGSGTLNPPSPSSSPGGSTSQGAPRPLLLSSSARRAHNGSIDEPLETSTSSRRSSMAFSTRSPSVSPVLSRSVHLPLLSPDLSIPPLSRSSSRGSHGRTTSSVDTPTRCTPAAAQFRPRSASASRGEHLESLRDDEEPLVSARLAGGAPSRRFGENGGGVDRQGGELAGASTETSLSGRKGWTLSDAPVSMTTSGLARPDNRNKGGTVEDEFAGLAIRLPAAANGLEEADQPANMVPATLPPRRDSSLRSGPHHHDSVVDSKRRDEVVAPDSLSGPSELPFVPPSSPPTSSALSSRTSLPPPVSSPTRTAESVSTPLPPAAPPSSQPSLSRGAKVVRRPPVGKNRSSRGSSMAGSVDFGGGNDHQTVEERRIASEFLTRSTSRKSVGDTSSESRVRRESRVGDDGARVGEDVGPSNGYDESSFVDSYAA